MGSDRASVRRPFQALDYAATMRLAAFENFVRERLGGVAATTPFEAHMLLDGRADRYTPEIAWQTTGILLLFGFQPREDGTFHRCEVWPEDVASLMRSGRPARDTGRRATRTLTH